MMVTLRSLVILACLVAVPLWAIFGTTLPAKLVSYFGGQERPVHEARANAALNHGVLAEAPAFRPAVVTAPTGRAPQSAPFAPQNDVAATLKSPEGAPPSNERDPIEPQPFGQPLARAATPAEMPRSMPGAASTPGANIRAGFDAPAPAAASALAPREQFTGLERHLRELGASYYRLETWGENGELYRFHCDMAIAGSPGSNQHFEATDRDALQAMARVVQQVEDWRLGRAR